MNRRDTFEMVYAEAHDWPIETIVQHRMGDTYRLPLIAKCWRFWNLALDSEGQESMVSVADDRVSQAIAIHQSENVVSITPIADRTEFVLAGEAFNKFTELLDGPNDDAVQNLLSRKPRWDD